MHAIPIQTSYKWFSTYENTIPIFNIINRRKEMLKIQIFLIGSLWYAWVCHLSSSWKAPSLILRRDRNYFYHTWSCLLSIPKKGSVKNCPTTLQLKKRLLFLWKNSLKPFASTFHTSKDIWRTITCRNLEIWSKMGYYSETLIQILWRKMRFSWVWNLKDFAKRRLKCCTLLRLLGLASIRSKSRL